jgi:hypothetical protein
MALNSSNSFDKYFNKRQLEDGTEIVDFLDDSILDHEWETINRVGRISAHHKDRLDFLASELLQENMFWWVLLLANEEIDPFDGFSQGDLIIAPNRAEIFDAFEEYK